MTEHPELPFDPPLPPKRDSPSRALLRYFGFEHLPEALQDVSRPLHEMARFLERVVPDGPEKTVGMRKLLEAKDAFVRAALDLSKER